MTALTLSEAATRAGVSRSTIRRRHKDGAFPNAQLVRSEWRIPEADLIAANLIPEPGPAYSVTMLSERDVTPPPRPDRGQMDTLPVWDEREMGKVSELNAQIVDLKHRLALAETVVAERGQALADLRQMRAIQAAPSRPWWAFGARLTTQ